MNRRLFTKHIIAGAAIAPWVAKAATQQPNILFAIADDWGTHAGVYGDKVIKTPTFDQLAKDGILFEHAYISSPSCAPSRAAILTGQWHWRLEEAANLYGPIPANVPLYPDLLEAAGYFVGYTRKGWGPGKNGDRSRNPAGNLYKNFAQFLAERPKDKPFCFWFGSHDPHRPYVKDTGEQSGIPLDQIEVPADFPDSPEVRGDIADYYFAAQRFDRETGEHIEQVRAIGELDNTIVVMTSDHGMPFPRGKSNIYDRGAHVPLAIYWPGHYAGGHRIEDFVSSTDYAPTFLESAGLPIPAVMTGRSLVPLLTAGKDGWIDPARRHVLFGKERHVPSQAGSDSGGYPCRAIRTEGFLLIRNFAPDRWPAGTEDYKNAFITNAWLADCDNGPTKTYMVENRDKDAEHRRLFDLSFAKRPEFELYDLHKDPNQQINQAANPEYAEVFKTLSKQLNDELRDSGDPRVVGGGEKFDTYPYSGGAPTYPGIGKPKRKPKK
ncbi:MAG: sulfatase [Kiritimatiellales bacterium]|nr:sulfatase [Kiritimatiellales bacterium]MCF7864255.1 sulfatase [Kiritimatiellales bacterium]